MNVSTILDQIDIGAIALPEFQRGYVWNRDQVRKLMSSLYNDHPVGSLLVWETKTELVESHTRGDGKLSAGSVRLLLDGQQRITSLYSIIRGKSPQFFEGNDKAFTGLYFNLEEENFEFHAQLKMQNNPLWINVTEVMQEGAGTFMVRLLDTPEFRTNIQTYSKRIMNPELWQIENYREFLNGRRELLAYNANQFLNSLLSGSIPEPEQTVTTIEVSLSSEEQALDDINSWVQQQGLPAGQIMYELVTDMLLDLAWSNGLQEGKSQPVALIFEKDNQIEAAANSAGYRYFTSIDSFKNYVTHEILVLESAPVLL